jgi:hypothetical protein
MTVRPRPVNASEAPATTPSMASERSSPGAVLARVPRPPEAEEEEDDDARRSSALAALRCDPARATPPRDGRSALAAVDALFEDADANEYERLQSSHS